MQLTLCVLDPGYIGVNLTGVAGIIRFYKTRGLLRTPA